MNAETNPPARTSLQHHPQRQTSPGVFAMSRLRTALGLLAVLSAPFASAQTKAAPQLLPYTITAVAGGGPVTSTVTSAIASSYTPTAFTVGQACATGSALTSTDTFGDGCLATQVGLVLPYSVTADSMGNVYLIDGYHALIRRVDARTGIITAVAGQGTAIPAAGAACGTTATPVSTSALGDGCLATQIKLASPESIAFDPSGNLWFADYTLGAVRRIDRTTGIISTVVNAAGTPGYRAGNVSNPGTVVAAAAGQLVKPYGITFDRAGNLYIADDYNQTVEVVNLQSSATTIATVSIPAGPSLPSPARAAPTATPPRAAPPTARPTAPPPPPACSTAPIRSRSTTPAISTLPTNTPTISASSPPPPAS